MTNKAHSNLSCKICGSSDIMAKISGEYYCYKCGTKIILENVRKQIEEWKKLGLISDKIEK